MNFKLITLVASAAFLAACASPAKIENMVVSGATSVSESNSFRNQVAVKEVTGGGETNPMWTSQISGPDFERALEQSLNTAGLGAAKQAGNYYVIADLEKLDQPFVGFNMTVTAYVKYTVVERKTGKSVYERIHAVPFTATVSDAFMAAERLRIANEGAAKINIKKFIDELVQLGVSKIAVR